MCLASFLQRSFCVRTSFHSDTRPPPFSLQTTIRPDRVYDTQCGAKIFRATNDLALQLSRPFDSRWIFDVELIARLQLQRELDIRSAMPGQTAGAVTAIAVARDYI